MPCFKGLAVSIHTNDGPLPEYSIQKQSRQSRISSYIPVPAPKLNTKSGEPEQSTFAVSITLLTPGQPVPYSRPTATSDDPDPQPKIVGGLPSLSGERGRYGGVIGPYIPLTSSANETVAAYIYFDGRAKEEVATLLRRSEETWVNSRWVSVPESEGGGLAEREFLFREVGLERWLNGLDLQGPTQDVKEKIIERRKRRLERHRLRKAAANGTADDEMKDSSNIFGKDSHGALRYGEHKQSPLENLSMDEDSDSEDEPPAAEAAGQIKVSLFRVMASGEIKRGEYSPQFDAHDDEDGHGGGNQGSSGDADVDHTTSFAKPKTLDPASISTQTVTGIDPPDQPYATFTFFYRGRKQLQKMGILPSSSNEVAVPTTEKGKTGQVDFTSLSPLKSNAMGTVGFASYRDPTSNVTKKSKRKGSQGAINDHDDDDDEMDSDEDDDRRGLKNDANDTDDKLDDIERRQSSLSEEELRRRGELAEGVKKIHLKRQLSFDASQDGASSGIQQAENSPTRKSTDEQAPTSLQPTATPLTSPTAPQAEPSESAAAAVQSPFKKARASVSGVTDDLKRSLFTKPPMTSAPEDASNNVQPGFGGPLQPANGTADTKPQAAVTKPADVDEEL